MDMEHPTRLTYGDAEHVSRPREVRIVQDRVHGFRGQRYIVEGLEISGGRRMETFRVSTECYYRFSRCLTFR